jgi:small subunit ribosomal protein S9
MSKDTQDNDILKSKPIDLEVSNSPNVDKLGRAYATGRRKTSVSRVWVKYGKNQIIVNGKKSTDYFKRKILNTILEEPIEKTDNLEKLEIFSTVVGGGLSGQAGAIRHGISRALVNLDPNLRKKLKNLGFLTRDARKVERKKFGRHKARRSPQFSKR